MTIDYDDPQAVLDIIRPAYYALLSGGRPQTIEIPTPGGTSKRVTYHATDVKELGQEVRRLEAIVAQKRTGKRQRYAFRAG